MWHSSEDSKPARRTENEKVERNSNIACKNYVIKYFFLLEKKALINAENIFQYAWDWGVKN